MFKVLDNYFEITKRGSTYSKEVLGGITTFMSMAYILAVQPALMNVAGMPVGAVAVGVAIIAALATAFMGIYSKYPFALAPGMGTNIFFAYTLVAGGIMSWNQGLSVVFIAGVLFLILTLFGFREAIANALPTSVKLGIGSSVGIFLVYLGMKSGNIINIEGGLISKGDFTSPETFLTLIGLFLIIVLHLKNVKGDILIGMLLTTLIGIPLGITKLPDTLMSLPPSIAPIMFKMDFNGLLGADLLPFIFVFFVGDFFSTLGTLLGVSSKAGFLDKDGNLPQIEKPFLVDAIATVGGALMGITTVTTYVESASGVSVGARTGFSSIITAICFLLALFFTPIMLMIPSQATAPCLIIIGFMLLDGLQHINFGTLDDTMAPLSMLTVTAFTASISNGIAVGILAYVLINCIKGDFRKISPVMAVLSVILGYYLMS